MNDAAGSVVIWIVSSFWAGTRTCLILLAVGLLAISVSLVLLMNGYAYYLLCELINK